MSKATLFEHREMSIYGSPFTECPSGRIPWEELIAMATEAERLKTENAVLKVSAHFSMLALLNKWQDLSNALAYMSIKPQN